MHTPLQLHPRIPNALDAAQYKSIHDIHSRLVHQSVYIAIPLDDLLLPSCVNKPAPTRR